MLSACLRIYFALKCGSFWGRFGRYEHVNGWNVVPIILLVFGLVLGGAKSTSAQPDKPLTLRPPDLQKPDSVYRVALAQHDSLLLAEAYYLYGKRYASAGQHLTAKRWLLRSLRIQETFGDTYELGRLYMRFADLEADGWHQAAALRYNRQALAVFKKINSVRGLATACSRLAHLHLGDHPAGNYTENVVIHPDSAAYYINIGRRWSSTLNDPLFEADWNELTGARLLIRQQPEAIQHLQKALAIHRQHSAEPVQIRSEIRVGMGYLSLGKPQQARVILDGLRRQYDWSRGQEYDIRILMETLSMAYYEAVDDWKRAFLHGQNLRQLERNGLIADRDGAITRLSVEYETEKKDVQLQAKNRELALQKENLRTEQRFTRAMIALLIGAVAGIVVFARLYRQKNRLSQRNAELVREQNHRVKNNLQVVSSLLNLYAHRLTDPVSRMAVEESQLRVETMALLQRQLYDQDRLTTINLAAFIPELIEGVLQTYGLDDLQPTYYLDECELSVDDALPVGLIINELTTNACKYAFARNANPLLWVTVGRQGTRVDVVVADNGPGLPERLLHQGKELANGSDSFGLQLIKMQVEQLEGSYEWTVENGTRFHMNFTNTPTHGVTTNFTGRG
ncbi:MAG: sensor histidine kinase [Cytophagales bacterium]|nr:MAG: sensor histidine kinase [Cytophagales bacterium]